MSFNLSELVRSKEHQNLSGKLRPSGRFSFAQIFPKRSNMLNREKGKFQVSQGLRTVQELDDAYARIVGGASSALSEMSTNQAEGVGGIGLSIAVNSDIRPARGSKGISSSARDVLCWSANQLERVYRRENMSFATLTLPALTEVDLLTVQGEWSKIVNDIVREIKRELRRRDLSSSVVGCTELQLERGETDGLIWPHLHLVFRGRRHSHSAWLLSSRRLRALWRGVIGRVVSVKAYDWKSSENLQQVRKSCGGYLAKYISKAKSKGAGEVRGTWHPSDWIIVSRSLRRLYQRLSISGYDIASVLAELCRNWVPTMGYKQPVVISTPAYGDRTIGQWGWLKDEAKFLSPMEWYSDPANQ